MLFALLVMAIASVRAQVTDALKGVWPVTDKALMKSLNGEWRLKVVKGITNNKTVPAADGTWGMIPVPGCWESLQEGDKTSGIPYSFCEPRYSFPDSLTGYYRTEFTVPKEWKGQQVIIRLDGVLRGYDLWLNDQLVGTWEQAYNTCLFDMTPYLTKRAFKGEPQRLAMRVYSRFKGFEFDCFDDWAPMGIFRDVTLFPVPKTHLSNLTVTTKMNGEIWVDAQVANSTSKTATLFEVLDADGQIVSTGEAYDFLEKPMLWTAETPYLYTLRVKVLRSGQPIQTFTQKIGFREITIEAQLPDTNANILKLNGQPIKLRGVTCHSTDPKTVKVISDELTLKDMRMMKEASINYIRTSHYPREPRFYELADSLGFYVISEAPMGSRGEKNLSKPDYQDIMRSRVAATIQRDKNHPSVIVWSIGNENPLPQSCQRLGEYAKTFDATRPICYPQKGSYFRSVGFEKFPKVADIYAPHYPTTSQLRDYYTKTDRPLIFTEYCHTLGISFEDHDRQWEIIERTPGIAGGSVWEWADQGMPFMSKGGGSKWRTDGSESDQRVYTSIDGGFEMNGNFGTDGLVYADRTPLPNYYELQHNYARAFATIDHSPLTTNLQVQCHNRYDFLNLKDNVTFHWALTCDRDTIARGAFSPDCPPHSSVMYPLTVPFVAVSSCPQSFQILHLDVSDAEGLTFLHQSFVLTKPSVKWTGTGDCMQRIQDMTVRTGRKATMAERITQKKRLIPKYLLPLSNNQVQANVNTTLLSDGGQEIAFTLTPDTADVFRSELGLAFLLDASIDRVQWIGQGPFASYPGRHQANRYGFWAKHMDDLYFEGNHGGVDAALLTDEDGNGLLVTGDSLDLNFEQTDRGIVLTVNVAVSGQGPKFAKTAFNGWKPGNEPVDLHLLSRGTTFQLYRINAGETSDAVRRLFLPASDVPAPFHPFVTQYDTYLLKYSDIKDNQ